MSSNIDYDYFSKISMMVGTIKTAEDIPKADKLYKLTVDIGPSIGIRQIVAGIKGSYEKKDLIDKQIIILVNLEPRSLRGVESQGMLLAASVDGKAILLKPEVKAPNGTIIK
jgi:methionyl-tRNA synthetase